VRNVLDSSVLVVEAVVHFFTDVSAVLLKLSDGVCLDLGDAGALGSEF